MYAKKHLISILVLCIISLFGLSIFINYLFVGNKLFTSFSSYTDGILYGFLVGLIFWIGNWSIGRYTGRKVNWRKNPQRANMISLLSFIVFGIFASVLVPFFYFGVFHKYYDNLLETVVVKGFINLGIDVILVSIFYSRYLAFYYAKSLQNAEDLKRESLIAKYEALKNQVNPHFLFNSLNTLTGVVEQSPEKAVDFIKKLSDIYRYVLEQKNKELVNVTEEVKFVKDYFHLSQIRHGKALSMDIQLPESQIFLAPLGLQLLVENAIKHNAISDDMPLHIEIGAENDYVYVKNNRQKKTIIKKNGTMGLENLKNRYTYITDKPVIIIDSDYEFMVKLPIIDSPQL